VISQDAALDIFNLRWELGSVEGEGNEVNVTLMVSCLDSSVLETTDLSKKIHLFFIHITDCLGIKKVSEGIPSFPSPDRVG
jgi:hypothetical protein